MWPAVHGGHRPNGKKPQQRYIQETLVDWSWTVALFSFAPWSIKVYNENRLCFLRFFPFALAMWFVTKQRKYLAGCWNTPAGRERGGATFIRLLSYLGKWKTGGDVIDHLIVIFEGSKQKTVRTAFGCCVYEWRTDVQHERNQVDVCINRKQHNHREHWLPYTPHVELKLTRFSFVCSLRIQYMDMCAVLFYHLSLIWFLNRLFCWNPVKQIGFLNISQCVYTYMQRVI